MTDQSQKLQSRMQNKLTLILAFSQLHKVTLISQYLLTSKTVLKKPSGRMTLPKEAANTWAKFRMREELLVTLFTKTWNL